MYTFYTIVLWCCFLKGRGCCVTKLVHGDSLCTACLSSLPFFLHPGPLSIPSMLGKVTHPAAAVRLSCPWVIHYSKSPDLHKPKKPTEGSSQYAGDIFESGPRFQWAKQCSGLLHSHHIWWAARNLSQHDWSGFHTLHTLGSNASTYGPAMPYEWQ